MAVTDQVFASALRTGFDDASHGSLKAFNLRYPLSLSVANLPLSISEPAAGRYEIILDLKRSWQLPVYAQKVVRQKTNQHKRAGCKAGSFVLGRTSGASSPPRFESYVSQVEYRMPKYEALMHRNYFWAAMLSASFTAS
jgi:hypothetical protein